MNLTITLDETQAAQLHSQASTRQISPEQFARDLLRDALGKIEDEEKWGALNRRRVELIRKSHALGLTAEEAEELARLQAAVDQRLELMDRQLLASAEHWRHLAEQLPDEPNP
jgi:hypothetical protein